MNNYNLVDTGINRKSEPYILIEDTGVGMSITNAAEDVIRDLYGYLDIKGKHIYYTDTDGQTDELLHDNNGNFIDFKFGNEL